MEKLEAEVKHLYSIECLDKNGKLKWREEFKNLTVTGGVNFYLSQTLVSGTVSPVWYVGLAGTGSFAAADVMTSHSGWSEIAPYSNATRPAWTPGAVSGGSVSNSGSPASFSINTSSTVYGAFLVNNNSVSGTGGTLMGGGMFGTARSVVSGDTLNVTITCSITGS